MKINVEFHETETIDAELNTSEPIDVNMEIGTITQGIVPDYNPLENKPQVNGNTLIGNKSTADLGIQIVGEYDNENLNIKLL